MECLLAGFCRCHRTPCAQLHLAVVLVSTYARLCLNVCLWLAHLWFFPSATCRVSVVCPHSGARWVLGNGWRAAAKSGACGGKCLPLGFAAQGGVGLYVLYRFRAGGSLAGRYGGVGMAWLKGTASQTQGLAALGIYEVFICSPKFSRSVCAFGTGTGESA